MPLKVAIGHSSLTGPRERNEDFCGIVTPEGVELENKGLIAAVADGIGGHRGGREAAEYTVRGLLADYYATPDTWSVQRALEKVLVPLNRWIMTEASRQADLAGMATTLTVLVLRGRRFISAHVGDTRLYLLRGGTLTQLTTDHVWEHPELKNVLSRAVGLDRRFMLDFFDDEMEEGDCFLLCSDGVWGALGDRRMRECLLEHPDAQEAASALVGLALSSGGQDNASAVVARIEKLPSKSLRDSLEGIARLPVPPRFKPGQVIDGLRIEEIVHDSRATLLYKVTDQESGQTLVMKTLCPEMAEDADEIKALIMEEWRARRIVSPFFAQIIPADRRSCLYYLQAWYEGSTLQRMLDSDVYFPVADVVQHGIRLMRGLSVLHRLGIAHRDIKPANIHLGQDGNLRILDLGVAVSHSEEQECPGSPGTPSYMAPELLSGVQAKVPHDLYAAGVALYHLLTRKYPYGEIEPFQKPRFGEPVAPTRYRPDIPGWLENVLLKAVAKDPAQRFSSAEEFLNALECGANRRITRPRATPIAMRNPTRTWRMVAAVSLVVNLIFLLILVR
ncbi:bifunctional protein-serine/threonine kinase/phosphatase [Propionivibrio limicola]|uniref:bifunctional protein-serine/threonine kinase/phosphatase n=1 Tax=Propionivibrio limicola TaxID=167645 RepID=UPI001291FB44|nr:bifunctional protein-serine/threonine kinase/phosphatase [Propionivibrio limicola]